MVMTEATKPKRVRVVIDQAAHIDEAYTDAGRVAKCEPLAVDAKTAKRLVAAHPYLRIMED